MDNHLKIVALKTGRLQFHQKDRPECFILPIDKAEGWYLLSSIELEAQSTQQNLLFYTSLSDLIMYAVEERVS